MALDVAGSAENEGLRSLLAQRLVSQTTLHKILQALQQQPDLTSSSMESLSSAANGIFESVRQVERIQMQDGSLFEWEICDPNLLLARTLEECDSLKHIYVQAMQTHPCSEQHPWSLVVVFDEFTPGSIAFPQLERKTMSLAYNFLELGAAALSVASTWVIPAVARSCKLSDAVGGWSAVLAAYLKLHLLGDLSVQTVGVAFKVGTNTYTVYARLRCLCSDGEGLKMALDVKGHGGLRPCIRCQNCLKKDSGLAHRRPNFVEITCADHTKFILSTPDNLNAEVDAVLQALAEVQAGTLTQHRLATLETASGINANSNGLLADAALRPCFSAIDVINEDWMHGCLQDGVLNTAVNCLQESAIAKLGFTVDCLERFLKADWKFPKATRTKMLAIWRIFDGHAREHLDKTKKIKCQASELLGLYGLLRHWVFTVVAPNAVLQGVDLSAEIDAFKATCKVIDIIMILKKGYAADEPARVDLLVQLEAAIDMMIALQIAAYGESVIRPKHHRMQHIASQIRKHKFVIDAFVIERLHLLIKEALLQAHNPLIFEASLLRIVLLKQFEVLKGTIMYGLVGSSAPLCGFLGARVAREMRCFGMTIAVGDVVFRDEGVGKVTACVLEGSRLFTIVQVWLVQGFVTPHSRKCQPTAASEAWPAEHLEIALAWYVDGDHTVVLS